MQISPEVLTVLVQTLPHFWIAFSISFFLPHNTIYLQERETLKPWWGKYKHFCCTLRAVKGKSGEAGTLHIGPPRLEPDVAENQWTVVTGTLANYVLKLYCSCASQRSDVGQVVLINSDVKSGRTMESEQEMQRGEERCAGGKPGLVTWHNNKCVHFKSIIENMTALN